MRRLIKTIDAVLGDLYNHYNVRDAYRTCWSVEISQDKA